MNIEIRTDKNIQGSERLMVMSVQNLRKNFNAIANVLHIFRFILG